MDRQRPRISIEMKLEAAQTCVRHWTRMLKWVADQPARREPSLTVMSLDINEAWGGWDCALCTLCRIDHQCVECPVIPHCNDQRSQWKYVNHANTWMSWYIAGQDMLKELKSVVKYLRAELKQQEKDKQYAKHTDRKRIRSHKG